MRKSPSSLRVAAAFIATLALVMGALSTQVEAQTLEQAYKREFAFLAAEKNALQARVAEVETSGRDRVAAAQAEIDQLQGQVLAMSMQAERLSESLLDAERDAEVAAEHSDVIGSMLTQAAATLEKGGVQLPTVNDDDRAGQIKQLRFAFEKALPLLSEFSSVRKSPGSFFDEKGERIEGTSVPLGLVAGYGVHDQASCVLPAGGGDRV